ALEPIGRGKDADNARHWVRRVGLSAHADAVVQPRTQQMIDDVEPLFPLWIIDAANVDQATEAAKGVIAQEGHDLGHRFTAGVYGEFTKGNLRAFELGPKAIGKVSGELVKGGFVH